MLGLVWFALAGRSNDPAPGVLAPAVPAPVEIPSAQAPGPLLAERAPDSHPRMVLHGVMLQGKNGESSHALLGLDGQAARSYRVGELISEIWTVASIAADHVMIANGPTRARLELKPGAVSSAAPGAPTASASAPKDSPLPGFSPGLRANAGPPDAAALEVNRRFLKARQEKLGAAR